MADDPTITLLSWNVYGAPIEDEYISDHVFHDDKSLVMQKLNRIGIYKIMRNRKVKDIVLDLARYDLYIKQELKIDEALRDIRRKSIEQNLQIYAEHHHQSEAPWNMTFAGKYRAVLEDEYSADEWSENYILDVSYDET